MKQSEAIEPKNRNAQTANVAESNHAKGLILIDPLNRAFIGLKFDPAMRLLYLSEATTATQVYVSLPEINGDIGEILFHHPSSGIDTYIRRMNKPVFKKGDPKNKLELLRSRIDIVLTGLNKEDGLSHIPVLVGKPKFWEETRIDESYSDGPIQLSIVGNKIEISAWKIPANRIYKVRSAIQDGIETEFGKIMRLART